jgi:transcriptional regulator with XRE-family HTH domain
MSGVVQFSPNTAFGQVLRKHRLAAGLSQERLGLESGVQRNFISLIETGQNQPTITTIVRLSAALGIKASALIVDTENVLGEL